MGKTIAEKILSNHSGKNLKSGDIAICNVDFCFGQDGTSGIIIDRFKELGAKKAFNNKNFYMVIDHNAPSPNEGASKVHKKMREFADKYSTGLYDIGCGVCHQLIPERGHVVPGDLVLGADSHTCTYGAMNVFSTGVGSTDLAITLATGKNWFKVPETIKIIVKGKLPKGVFSKDIILHIIGKIGANGCTYKSAEFCGQAIENLSVDERFTISNMAVEMGAKCGLMEADKKVLDWAKAHSKRTPNPISADKDAKYFNIIEFNVSKISPQIAKPHTVDNNCSIEEIEGLKINEAFLGTCTNGRLTDLAVGAKLLKGKTVHKDVRLIVAPASKDIYLEALKKGYIEIFIKAGASVVAPGCGPCVGTHEGVLADEEIAVSTANRNFKGRMGNPKAFIYLASPATVVASAIKGVLADPRKLL